MKRKAIVILCLAVLVSGGLYWRFRIQLPVELCRAAWTGDAAKIQELINAGADVNAGADTIDIQGTGNLRLQQVWSYRFQATFDPDHRDRFTPLHYACWAKNENEEVVELLLRSGANVNAINGREVTPLRLAVGRLHTKIVDRLIAAGADVHIRVRGSTALHYSGPNASHMLKALIAAGAEIEARDPEGQTPLLYFCHRGDVEGLRVLLSAGADIHANNQYGAGALHSAARTGNDPIIRELIAAGADVNARDKRGRTPLHDAVVSNKITAVKTLIDVKADVNAKDQKGLTPLDVAQTFRHYSGPAARAPSSTGWIIGYPEIAEILKVAGAK